MIDNRVPFAEIDYRSDGLYHCGEQPFTGVAFILGKDGRPQAEMTFQEGLRWGLSREWYREGQPMVLSNWAGGVLHGRATEWHRNGQVAEDGEYAYGVPLWEKVWDEDGVLMKERLREPSR